MVRILLPVMALLFSVALLLVGHGLLLTLLPLRAQTHGFTPTQIGLTASAYFIGFVVGCLTVPRIVRRSGHIRSFAALGAVFSAVALVFDMVPQFGVWVLLRFGVGACMAGAYMVIESWLNERATHQTRGTILSIYSVVGFLMVAVGQQLLNLAPQSPATLYSLAAILISLAIIPVSLTLSLAPTPIQNVHINLVKVWHLSHIGLTGAVVAGLVTGSFWALAPVYARGVGLDVGHLTMFISAAVLGGAAFQLPLGRLSDHFDRRLIVFFSTLAGAATSLLIVVVSGFSSAGYWPLILLSFIWGGCTMTIYAVCLAHANDHAQPEDFVMVGSAMLLALGVSSAIGAPLASLFMTWMGPANLFTFFTICLVLFAVAISVRRRSHVLPVREESETPFHLISGTSPVALELDPRTEEGGAEDGTAQKTAS